MNFRGKIFDSAGERLAFVAMTCCFLGVNVAWLCLHRAAPTWDDSWYLASSLRMFDALTQGGIPGYARRFFTILGTKGPLITVLPTPIYLLLGRDFRYAYIVNLVFMPVLFVALYSIAKTYWSSRAGFTTVYLVGTMPLFYGLARWYLVEYALAGFTCLALCLLARSANLENIQMAFGFGVTCALGLLLKVFFPLYVLLPFLFVLTGFLRSARCRSAPEASSKPSRLSTMLALGLPTILLAAPWYAVNYRRVIHRAVLSGFSEEADFYGTGDVFSLRAIRAYLVHLANSGPSGYYVLLTVVLLGLVGITGKARALLQACPREARVMLSLWVLPFLVFLFGRNKDIRFVAPLLPAFALALAFILDFTLSAWPGWRRAGACFLLAFPLVGLLQTSFGVLGNWKLALGPFRLIALDLGYARIYDGTAWLHPAILKAICDSTKFEAGERKRLVVGTDTAGFNGNNFELAAVQEGLPFDVETTAYEESANRLLLSMNSIGFFVYQEGGEPESRFYNKYGSAILQGVRGSAKFAELRHGLRLRDGGVVRILKNLSPYSYILHSEFRPSGPGKLTDYEVDFDHQIQLTGLAIKQTANFLEVIYRWRCVKPPDREYWCFTHILDERDKVIGFLDHRVLDGDPPMWAWRAGDVAVEDLRFDFSTPWAGGRLRLRLGLFDRASGQRLPIVGAAVLGGTRVLPLADHNTAVLVDSPVDGAGLTPGCEFHPCR